MNKHDKGHIKEFVKWIFKDFIFWDYLFMVVITLWGALALTATIYGWRLI